MWGMGKMGMRVPRNSIPMMDKEVQFGYINMGGMMTFLKVREDITTYEDPGWYKFPEGTVARSATPEELRADGIDIETNTTKSE